MRQHLAWHPRNELLRFAPAPNLLADSGWRRGLTSLRKHDLACEIEIVARFGWGLRITTKRDRMGRYLRRSSSTVTPLDRRLVGVQLTLPCVIHPT